MKTKLTKMIMSSLAFACALVLPGCRDGAGPIRYRAGGTRPAGLQRGHAEGLVFVELGRVRKLRWEPGTESRYGRQTVQRRWYNVAMNSAR